MARPIDGPFFRALFTSFLHRVKDSAATVDKIFEDIRTSQCPQYLSAWEDTDVRDPSRQN